MVDMDGWKMCKDIRYFTESQPPSASADEFPVKESIMKKVHSFVKSVAVLASAGMLMTACKKDYDRTGMPAIGSQPGNASGTGYGNQGSGVGGAGDTSRTGLYGQPAVPNPAYGTGSPDMIRSGMGGAGMDTGTAKMDTSKHMGKTHTGKKHKHERMHPDSTMKDTGRTGTQGKAGATGTGGSGSDIPGSDIPEPNVPAPMPGPGSGGSGMPGPGSGGSGPGGTGY